MKYRVSVTIDATISVVVDADSVEEAKTKALDEASRPCLCNQCARELDVGDPLDAIEAYPE